MPVLSAFRWQLLVGEEVESSPLWSGLGCCFQPGLVVAPPPAGCRPLCCPCSPSPPPSAPRVVCLPVDIVLVFSCVPGVFRDRPGRATIVPRCYRNPCWLLLCFAASTASISRFRLVFHLRLCKLLLSLLPLLGLFVGPLLGDGLVGHRVDVDTAAVVHHHLSAGDGFTQAKEGCLQSSRLKVVWDLGLSSYQDPLAEDSHVFLHLAAHGLEAGEHASM